MHENVGHHPQPPVERLTELRRQIDDLNRRILELVQERAEVVLAIAEVKRELDLEGFDPRREEEMLRALERASSGPFGPAAVRRIFGAILSASRELHERAGSARPAAASPRPR